MKIAVDKNQFSGSHGKSNSVKHKQMENMGAILVPVSLPFGDYCKITDEIQSIIDSKKKVCKKDLEAVIPLSIDTKKIYKSYMEMYVLNMKGLKENC